MYVSSEWNEKQRLDCKGGYCDYIAPACSLLDWAKKCQLTISTVWNKIKEDKNDFSTSAVPPMGW